MFFPSFGRPSVTLSQICYYPKFVHVQDTNTNRPAFVIVELKEKISVIHVISILNVVHRVALSKIRCFIGDLTSLRLQAGRSDGDSAVLVH